MEMHLLLLSVSYEIEGKGSIFGLRGWCNTGFCTVARDISRPCFPYGEYKMMMIIYDICWKFTVRIMNIILSSDITFYAVLTSHSGIPIKWQAW